MLDPMGIAAAKRGGQVIGSGELRGFALLGFWLFFGATALSFAGVLHGVGDSFAVFRHWWSGGLAVCSLGLLYKSVRGLALVGIAAAGLSIATVASSYLGGSDAPGQYSIYQKNLLFHAFSPNRVIRDIRTLSPDFITLEEIQGENRALYWILAKEYGAGHRCAFTAVGDVAVVSRWPMIEGSGQCMGNQGAAAMQVETPDGPVWVVAVHLHWPYPHQQAQQVARLVEQMEFLESAPVVLGGDFNMVPWSHTMAQLQAVTGSKRAGPTLATFDLFRPRVRLPIDHILVPSGRGQLETRPLLGSDHSGLFLRFDF